MFVYFQPKTVRRGAVFVVMAVLAPVTYYFYSTYGIFINVVVIFMNCVFPMLAMNLKTTARDIKKDINMLWTYCEKAKNYAMSLSSKKESG
jgi:hypothetical protein